MDTHNSHGDVVVTSKKKKKTGLFIAIGVACLIVIAVIVIIVARSSNGNKYESKIKAAEKYLSELDYENAIASYKAAIEINPTAVEAYLGLADIYLAMGKPDEAVAVLQEGINTTGSDELKEKLDVLTERNLDDEETKEDAEDSNSTADSIEESDIEDDNDPFKNAEVGGYVTFGTYEQDGDESNGPEPIEWEVLDINENGMLLVSRYVLDAQPYNIEFTEVTWETCTLRGWLNNDFLNTAFDSNEQSIINTTYIVNADNSLYGAEGGNDTYDKIFCLSLDEIFRYYQFNTYTDEYAYPYGYCQRLMIEPTQYAIDRGVYKWTMSQDEYNDYYAGYGYSTDAVGKVGALWWLRFPGLRSGSHDVGPYGHANAGVYRLVNDHNGVRPALYVHPQELD